MGVYENHPHVVGVHYKWAKYTTVTTYELYEDPTLYSFRVIFLWNSTNSNGYHLASSTSVKLNDGVTASFVTLDGDITRRAMNTGYGTDNTKTTTLTAGEYIITGLYETAYSTSGASVNYYISSGWSNSNNVASYYAIKPKNAATIKCVHGTRNDISYDIANAYSFNGYRIYAKNTGTTRVFDSYIYTSDSSTYSSNSLYEYIGPEVVR